ncbi:SusE domain-containing protein [Epilithonimonas xixisoli]|uniref:Uncharacterized protein DUF5019 n=1 Tax=Epilithonimonas xixisoli TaxID=1476462 RepID=A0A4R8I561_9FLAO|nr:SusE domain-containing protein [Epilithonimonas xixisoli]TDX83120.1 uncharacterized protein DUF5019 [Epilithonimonas xixisoli]
MKNYNIYKFFFAIVVFLGIISCEEREELVIDSTGSPIVMDLSKESVFLDGNFPNNPALTVNWEAASYSIPTEVNYIIEASSTENFTEPYVLGTFGQSVKYATFTAVQMNNAAAGIGLPANVAGKMYLKIKSYIGTTQQLQQESNVTSVMVTPYKLVYPDFFLVGEASYVGWTASAAQILHKSENESIIYTYLEKDKNFRFLGQQDWNPINYSIDDATTDAGNRYFKQVSSNITVADHENMKFGGESGIYKVVIDADKTVQSLKITASPILAFDIPQVYLVGNVAGVNWTVESAVAMTKTGAGVFEFTTTLPADAEFKFLGQQSWGALDWGNISSTGNTGFLGPKDDNGNIKFAGDGGSYKITVNIKAGIYTIVKQ